jgi:hypothetical protein
VSKQLNSAQRIGFRQRFIPWPSSNAPYDPKPHNPVGGSGGGAAPTRHHAIRRVEWRTILALLFLSALLCIVTAEVAARVFWRVCCGISLLKPDQILYAYYPELRSSGVLPEALHVADPRRPAHGDEFYDVLFLGGSVLQKDWGSVEMELREQLASLGQRNVRVFNLAQPAHTSRDSLLKYAALGEARFDLVIFYHGINEARTNNAPPEIYREDYAHYSWYETVNALAPYHGTALLALPYTLRYFIINIRHNILKDRYSSTYVVRKDWVQYGRDSRSVVSFQHNLSAILDLASQHGDQVLIMTFATYVPENYSLEAFRKKQLDYGLHRSPIEWWGAREHVLATVAVHNEIVRSMAAQHKNVLFVDQASLMPRSSRYFNDPCHFTVLGSAKFVENLIGVLPSIGKSN